MKSAKCAKDDFDQPIPLGIVQPDFNLSLAEIDYKLVDKYPSQLEEICFYIKDHPFYEIEWMKE